MLQAGGGLGAIALAHLLAGSGRADPLPQPKAEFNGGLHHVAKARRVIQLFMNGGASQVDTFDYKPELERRDGQQDDLGVKTTATGTPVALLKSPFTWKQYGGCGRWVSSVLPKMAEQVDRMAFLMAMTSPSNVHGPASYLQNTGFLLPGYPCLGSWVSYGLGRMTDNLPTFVVIPDHRGLPYNGNDNFSSAFLPAIHSPMILKPNANVPIPFLFAAAGSPDVTPESESAGLNLLRRLNSQHQASHPGDSRLEARIESFELAAHLQLHAPEALDISAESPATLELFGLNDESSAPFGRSCLVGRRLLERGVRFVQIWSGIDGPTRNWDHHADIPGGMATMAKMIDGPIAALLVDLQQRGMLDDTLVIWTTEFGRMPFSQGSNGRDHNGGTFVNWLAGGGTRGGVAVGQSDPFGLRAQENATTGYDLHATVLHLLGIDHRRLTVRHNGIDRRLTDVNGQIIRAVLA